MSNPPPAWTCFDPAEQSLLVGGDASLVCGGNPAAYLNELLGGFAGGASYRGSNPMLAGSDPAAMTAIETEREEQEAGLIILSPSRFSTAAESSVRSSNAASTLMRRKSSMMVGRGATAAVEVHMDADGVPLLAEKVIVPVSDDKLRAARTELLYAKRQVPMEPQPRGLVTLHDAYYNTDTVRTHILMEFMDAGHAGRLAPAREPVVAAVIAQVLHGLAALHDEPLRALHRDLKPENVLLNSRGEAKLADFGVAALLAPGQATAMDQQGTILQMSPERLRGEAHGPPSDVWSLGVTAAQMATGRHPFVPAGGASASTERFWMLAEVIRHTATPAECEAATRAAVAAALPAASPALRDFVNRCTAADPAGRATIADLLAHPFVRDVTSVDLASEFAHLGLVHASPAGGLSGRELDS